VPDEPDAYTRIDQALGRMGLLDRADDRVQAVVLAYDVGLVRPAGGDASP
jgi:hypothetical protein